MAINRLRSHDITLSDGRVVLRPMTEEDWDFLLRLNNDPEVLYYSEGDEVSSRSREEIQPIYRTISQSAYCFVIECGGSPVGECWLQELNLARLRARFPDLNCQRIDIALERAFWGQGIGGAAIRLLVSFGFDRVGAVALFGCDIADFNSRSRRAFEREGFALLSTNAQPPGSKARVSYDLVRFRKPGP